MRATGKTISCILPLLLLAAPARAGDGTAGFITNARQLTFAGRRAGEGYFSPDGRLMIFQSEREPENPFFQIYLMDLSTGDTRRLSPGTGRTTCSWLHPDGRRALFSSTHADPRAREKQRQEIERRKKKEGRRHRWNYDEHYDIFDVDLASGKMKNLTHTRGYDAEGSYSPDGKTILFASNRLAYRQQLEGEKLRQFERDPSVAMDLYLMNADGSGVRRLTTAWGQDGGPFFSADGKHIVWRRFSLDGLHAEIWLMDSDGGNQHQLTHLGAMSWAPFFHPSGEYIIFTTNRHGFDNFELYIIDSAGRHEPVRVTDLPGFDGLPVFTPDGRHLAWTSNRTPNHQGQIFLADWNHQLARYRLGLSRHRPAAPAPPAGGYLRPARRTRAEIRGADISRHVHYLASRKLAGRLAGTRGERLATAYVARTFRSLGLQPAGEDGGYFQPFDFVRGIRPGPGNSLVTTAGKKWRRGCDWQPLPYSQNGSVDKRPLVFVGHGISAELEGQRIDDYADLPVKGAWVMLLRDLPGGLDQAERLALAPWADLRRQVAEAKARGAAGVIAVTPPGAGFKKELVPLTVQGTAQRAGLVALSITTRLADELLRPAGTNLAELARACRLPGASCGLVVKDQQLSARVELRDIPGRARNVLGRLRSTHPERPPLLIGAHVDHIGNGVGLGSLARPAERGRVHPGADDNASGVAVMLELAQWFAAGVRRGSMALERDVVFAAWSAEELGLLGSQHYVKLLKGKDRQLPAACINMDMVGRLRDRLVLYGLETSPRWAELVEQANVALGLPVLVQNESMLPTDATSFALARVPVLSAFTGLHDEYNTPRDRPRTLNYPGAARIGRLLAEVARRLAAAAQAPVYSAPAKKPPAAGGRHGMRASLGTVPDFSAVDVRGVKLSGVRPGSPAARAGVRAGDVVVELAGQKIENLYDYARAIGALKVGAAAQLVVERAGRRMEFTVTPESRR
ncbi:MAG: peptidase M28 [Deltaproteobacteria bacterium]|nr:MAG: peptidase M28 [Deltaproteobacteria bacterium]